MVRLRGFMTALALVWLVSVSLAATVEVWRRGLPKTQLADRVDLVELLSTRRVADQPHATRILLARRLERDFRLGTEWESRTSKLTDEGWTLFEENLIELTDVWFRDLVDKYFDTPENERNTYIDEKISSIMRWQVIERPNPTEGANSSRRGNPLQLTKNVIERLQERMANADPQEVQRIEQFFGAVQEQMVIHMMERATGGGFPGAMPGDRGR